MPERRFTEQGRARVEARDTEGGGVVVGYGAVFYDGTPETQYELWPGVVERIMPGAFGRAVREDDVRVLFNHNPDNVLGRTSAGTARLSTDSRGLRYEADQPDTGVGRDVTTNIRRGDITGSSFSFRVGKEEWRTETQESGHTLEIREILGVDPLFDVGPVTFPAYEATDAGVRSASAPDEARASYDRWQAARMRERAKVRTRVGARMAEVESA